jgi:two-component system response regulator DesR
MIRTVVAHNGALVRGALAFVLATEEDIEVVAEVDDADEVKAVVLTQRPDVAVIDLDLLAGDHTPVYDNLCIPLDCPMLVLAAPNRSAVMASAVARREPGVGFLAKASTPGRFVDAVRRVARGDPVIDAELVAAALRIRNPLTPRESDVLALAAQGAPVKEIAHRLRLAAGTVRNHLSRIIVKTGARTRLEAVRVASESGWI